MKLVFFLNKSENYNKNRNVSKNILDILKICFGRILAYQIKSSS